MSAVLAGVVGVSAVTMAAPTHDRAYHGYPDAETNGYGATDSWAGSFLLYTGHGQSGEAIVGYCIQRGLNYPRGTDPDWANANSGFTLIGDVPAERGVSEADRQALAYALWRYGATTDDRTAAAMFLVTRLLSGDPDFGSTTVADTVLGANWPEPAAVKDRAVAIIDEARAKRGPWRVSVDVTHREADEFSATATLTGPAGPIVGEQLTVVAANATGGGDHTTDGDGRVMATVRVTDPTQPVEVAVGRPTSPSYYRVFAGRPDTQQVITDGGDGPALSATASAVIPTGSVQLTKTTTNPAYQSGAGAVFELRRDGADGPVEATLTIGDDGRASAHDVPIGAYALVEIAAPEGQVASDTPVDVTLTPGRVTEIEVVNDVVRHGEIILVKTDGDTGEPLGGAWFRIRFDSTASGVFDTPVRPGPDAQPTGGTAEYALPIDGDEAGDDEGEGDDEGTDREHGGGPAVDDDPPAEHPIDAAREDLWVSTGDPVAPTRVTGLMAGRYEVTEVQPPDGYTVASAEDRTEIVDIPVAALEPEAPDPAASQTVNVANRKPLITTMVRLPDPTPGDDSLPPGTAPPGAAVVDEIRIDNVAPDTTGVVTVVAYGPFDPDQPMACDAETFLTEHVVETHGSGTFESPPFFFDQPGRYTFVATAQFSDGSTATHACGLADESFAIAHQRISEPEPAPAPEADPVSESEPPVGPRSASPAPVPTPAAEPEPRPTLPDTGAPTLALAQIAGLLTLSGGCLLLARRLPSP